MNKVEYKNPHVTTAWHVTKSKIMTSKMKNNVVAQLWSHTLMTSTKNEQFRDPIQKKKKKEQ